MNKDYVIGIPTRGRFDMLQQTLEAISNQSLLPNYVVIVNNNDDVHYLDNLCFYGLDVRIIQSLENKSASAGHQLILEYAINVDVIVRWDDDLVPYKDCMENIVVPVCSGQTVACGGVYPRVGEKRKIYSKWNIPDGNLCHAQFFLWNVEQQLKTHHLYSSFAYNRQVALDVGGFCLEYSKIGVREETDFSLRINNVAGPLLINTKAVAVHYVVVGGTRDVAINTEQRKEMKHCDLVLFRKRMADLNIDWDF